MHERHYFACDYKCRRDYKNDGCIFRPALSQSVCIAFHAKELGHKAAERVPSECSPVLDCGFDSLWRTSKQDLNSQEKRASPSVRVPYKGKGFLNPTQIKNGRPAPQEEKRRVAPVSPRLVKVKMETGAQQSLDGAGRKHSQGPTTQSFIRVSTVHHKQQRMRTRAFGMQTET